LRPICDEVNNMECIGVIGCGYWGPNLIRNFSIGRRSRVKACADLDPDRLEHMRDLYPYLHATQDYQDVLDDTEITAVAIATPARTHHALAMAALRADKHVFVEKPLALSSVECRELAMEAYLRRRVLMVGHTFVYTAAVNKVRELIASGELGEIHYINSTRVNLGVFQPDINVIWDLAPHDISIMNYVLDTRPERLAAHAKCSVRPGVEDVAFIDLEYPDGVIANIHVSWLDPCKIRRTTVVGSRKMLVYDDVSSLEKIRVYDKGVTVPPHYDSFGEFSLSYRFGDILTPRLDDSEPLKTECRHFIDCIVRGERPRSDAEEGIAVVRALEATTESLRFDGRLLDIAYPVLET
jgi:predicted dehydrogenase